ncbi:MAG: hypothetical protein KF768_04300 [Phycisphaeraceae bacterium]|nr:hypothetical protein [Phycisphaeraceae bacterium]
MTNSNPNTNPIDLTKPAVPTSAAHADLPAKPLAAHGPAAPAPAEPIDPTPAHPPLIFPVELAETLRRGNIVAVPRRRTRIA